MSQISQISSEMVETQSKQPKQASKNMALGQVVIVSESRLQRSRSAALNPPGHPSGLPSTV